MCRAPCGTNYAGLILYFNCSVTVTISGAPQAVEYKDLPKHKKNETIGTKRTAFASTIIVDQADAQTFANGEEVRCGAPLFFLIVADGGSVGKILVQRSR